MDGQNMYDRTVMIFQLLHASTSPSRRLGRRLGRGAPRGGEEEAEEEAGGRGS